MPIHTFFKDFQGFQKWELSSGWLDTRGADVDSFTAHCNAMGDVQWKNVWQWLPLLSLLPFGEATRHHLPPEQSPQRRNLAPQGEVVCRTLSSFLYVSLPGRERTSQVYDDLGFGYSLVAAVCPGVAACHPQASAAALCSGEQPWQTAGCPY